MRGIRRVFRSGVPEQELREELAHHFSCTVEELMERGIPKEEAEREAARRFGDRELYERELERMDRRLPVGERVRRAGEVVRYAARRIRRAPILTAGVVLTFALGIGANAAMFGIVDRLLLSPPPHISEPEGVRRLMIEQQFVGIPGERSTGDVMTYPDYEDLKQVRAFSEVAAQSERELTMGRGEEARQVQALLVTPSYFPLLGTRPALGRFLLPEEDALEAEPVVVLGYGFWQDHFGGHRGIIGQQVDLGHAQYTVVGIAPRGFTGVDLSPVDLFLPLYAATARTQRASTACLESRGCWFLRAVGRLAPGANPELASAEATAAHRHGREEIIAEGYYDAEARILVEPLLAARGPLAGTEASVAKWLAAISLIVLLIASANVANLLLARSIRQQRETGIRLALGGSRRSVVGLSIVETLLLAALGGAAALLLNHLGGGLLRATLLPGVEWPRAGLDLRAAAFVVLLTLLTGVVAGVLPALQGSRLSLLGALRSGGRGASSGSSRIRDALTVVQAALSVVLLAGAGVFVMSLHNVRSQDLGVNPDGVLVITPVFESGLSGEERNSAYLRAAEQLRALPEVSHASVASGLPFYSAWSVTVRAPGLDSIPRFPGGGPYINAVDPDFFEVFGVRLVRGRTFTEADREGGEPVVVVSDLMARTLWPGEDALGKCLMIGSPEGEGQVCRQVVGLVGSFRRFRIVDEDEALQYFIPLSQLGEMSENIAGLAVRIRPGISPAAATRTIQRALTTAEPRLRTARVVALTERLDPQARAWSLGATMFTAFGVLALIVSGIGLYSVLAFNVAQRTFELGIRSALGAGRTRLMRLVLRKGAILATTGVFFGLLLTLLIAPRLEPLLFHVSARDPVVLAGAAMLLIAVGLLAGVFPARRATRVDPAIALRAE